MKHLIHTISSDLQTYDGNFLAQGFWALSVCRLGQWRYDISIPLVRKFFSVCYKLSYKVVQVLTGIELPAEATVGKGTRIDHFGNIIISGYAKIGDECVIRQGVTIGLKNEAEPCAPVIGNRVNIGAGAKILGNIHIGDDVEIGANAVVIQDIPEHCIAVGIPAKPKRKTS
ncbi:MAG: hypothetical protein MI748_12955 [Opitutales bacterium]|nr:hypothetical protein [Opitutales bacterium]